MFSGLNKFVADLEASVSGASNSAAIPIRAPSSPQRYSGSPSSPLGIKQSPSSYNSLADDTPSPSALAEQGFNALRRGFTKGAQQVTRAGKGSLEIVRQTSFNLASPGLPGSRPERDGVDSTHQTEYGFPRLATPPPSQTPNRSEGLLQPNLFAIGSDTTSRAATPQDMQAERLPDGSIIPQLAVLPPDSPKAVPTGKDEELAFFRAVNLALPGDQLEVPVTPAETPTEEKTEEELIPVLEAAPFSKQDISSSRSAISHPLEDPEQTPTLPATNDPLATPILHSSTLPGGSRPALETGEANIEQPVASLAASLPSTENSSPKLNEVSQDTPSEVPKDRPTTPPLQSPSQTADVSPTPLPRNSVAKQASLPHVNTSFKHGQKPSLGRLPSASIQNMMMSPTSPTTPTSEANRLRNQLDGLRAVLSQQNDRMKELRDAHQADTASMQSELVTLRAKQEKHNADIASVKAIAEEEQEKRSKSISLLKAIRQKMIQAEASKAETEKSLEKERELSRQERNKWEAEVTQLRSEKETTINKIRNAFERENTSMRSNFEAEISARKGQAELETLTTRAAHAKDIKLREDRIKEVERRLRELETERDTAHNDGQMKTAELESARSWTSSLEARIADQDVQLSDNEMRRQQLANDLETLRLQLSAASPKIAHTDELRRQASVDSDKVYSARINSLERQVKTLEAERQAAKDEMAHSMEMRLSEVERMRSEIAKRDAEFERNVKDADRRKERAEAAEGKVALLEERAAELEALLDATRLDSERAVARQDAIREDLKDRDQRISELESRLEDVLKREASAKAANKTLREELRKVSTGVLMAEKARNPGVGYFSTLSKSANGSDSVASTPLSPPPGTENGILTSSQQNRPSNESKQNGAQSEEAVNFEYIRNVILQFVEHKEMRVHLVGVLAVILHFTPQEQRRLAAKASA